MDLQLLALWFSRRCDPLRLPKGRRSQQRALRINGVGHWLERGNNNRCGVWPDMARLGEKWSSARSLSGQHKPCAHRAVRRSTKRIHSRACASMAMETPTFAARPMAYGCDVRMDFGTGDNWRALGVALQFRLLCYSSLFSHHLPRGAGRVGCRDDKVICTLRSRKFGAATRTE